jgi:hypothetical protein
MSRARQFSLLNSFLDDLLHSCVIDTIINIFLLSWAEQGVEQGVEQGLSLQYTLISANITRLVTSEKQFEYRRRALALTGLI